MDPATHIQDTPRTSATSGESFPLVDERPGERWTLQAERALMEVSKGLAEAHGHSFYQTLAKHIARALVMDVVTIVQPVAGNASRLRTLAVWIQGHEGEDFEYDSVNTPCIEVFKTKQLCRYRNDLRRTFPNCAALRDWDVNGYLGAPFFDSQGEVVGLVNVMSRNALPDGPLPEHVLMLFAQRISTEIARREADSAHERSLAKALRVRDEFLGSLSHELRTPMNIVLGWVHLLRCHGDEIDVARALETVESAARLQIQLLDDLLDVSALVAGRMTLATRCLSLSTVVKGGVEAVRHAADQKGVRLEFKADTQPIPPLVGDAERLRQVIWNLVSNAVRFTPSGGRVSVTLVRRDEITAEVRVIDTGEGIDEGFLPFVFERFRQEKGGLSRSRGGLGLGLAIVRHIVELHGGTVSVESEGKGRGACFRILLPFGEKSRSDGEAFAPEGNEPTPSPRKQCSVLAMSGFVPKREGCEAPSQE